MIINTLRHAHMPSTRSGKGAGGGRKKKKTASERTMSNSDDDADDKKTMSMFAEMLLQPQEFLDMDEVGGMVVEKRIINENFILPLAYTKLLKLPKGMLMYGPPGTGKTFITRAIPKAVNKYMDREHGTNLIVAQSSKLYSDKFGETEKNIAGMVEYANSLIKIYEEEGKYVPALSIIFVDEVDALVPDRSRIRDPSSGASDVVNAMLQAMDGARINKDGVLWIGTTNVPWDMDSAALRRFPIKIFVDLPDDMARRETIKAHIASRLGTDALIASAYDSRGNPHKWWTDVIDTLTMLTGWRPEAMDLIYETLSDEHQIRKQYINAFFSRYKDNVREPDERAIHVLGYTPSDIGNFIKAGLNQIAYAKLYSPRNKGGCSAVTAPEEWLPHMKDCSTYDILTNRKRSTALELAANTTGECALTLDARKKIKLEPEDLDKFFPAFAIALDEFRPSTSVAEYCKYVAYAIKKT